MWVMGKKIHHVGEPHLTGGDELAPIFGFHMHSGSEVNPAVEP